AIKGDQQFALNHNGATYYFSSATNRETFRKKPEQFMPAFGGWCAYAMGLNGEKVEVDPKTFKIVDGKLNLFYNRFFTNTLTDWNKNENVLKQKAAANWSKIIKQ
ncbi:MAG: YHS domain-containing protein, partial [Gemmatimonadaceae bacterium]|nr:YHS domain-containing protein [Chitinophagaceae bacterium]